MNIPDCCLQCPVLLSDPSLNLQGEGNPLKREQIDPMLLARNSRFIDVEPTRGGEVIVFGGADAGSKGGSDGPSRVGSFEILGEIGRGGMGIVYRARDTKLGRVVALKCPKREALAQPEFRKRFLNEARSASKIMHPNITTVFEVFEEDDVPWLVMELVEGASLRAMLGAHDPLSCEEVLKHAEGLADALRVAHSCGVLHLDINPNNVLVGRDGRARLTDFGLARAWADPTTDPNSSEASTNSHSSSSGVAGTRGYMSPEQALGKPVDPRSDLFSLGSVLYEMCTGRPAFYNTETGQWLDALLHREPEPISRVNHDVPIEFEEIVRKALAKRTFQRYQSANEMLLDLRAVRRRLQSDSGYSMPSFERRSRLRILWLGAACLAAGVVLAGVVVKGLPWSTQRAPELAPGHRRLTAGAGWEGKPAISPDGSMVAFTSDANGNSDIWLARSDGGDPLQLTDDPAADTDPAWYPDGSHIAFVSDRDGAPAVWRIPTLGGSPVKLLSDAADPAISPDGGRLAFSRPGADGLPRIGVVALDDPSQVHILTDADDGLWDHMHPAWSPDGTRICYADFKNLWLIASDGGEATRLTSADAVDRDPVWSPDGRYVIYSSAPEQSLELWSVRVADGSSYPLTAGSSEAQEPSLSRDGGSLVFSTSDADADIVVLDRTTGARTEISGATHEFEPAVAPDGSAIVFVSDRKGKFDLWSQPLRGGRVDGAPRRLTDHRGSVAGPTFSPDGRWIAYHRVVDGQRDVWVVPAAGGPPRQITDHPATDVNPTFAPDGSMIAFISDRDGSRNVWVTNLVDGRRTGESRRIVDGDGYWFPAWSPDGTRIASVVRDGYNSEIKVISVDPHVPPIRVTGGAGASRVRWSASGNELIVGGAWGSDRGSLRVVSLDDLETRPFEPEIHLGLLEFGAGMFDLDLTDRILAFELSERRGDLWLAEIEFPAHGFFDWWRN